MKFRQYQCHICEEPAAYAYGPDDANMALEVEEGVYIVCDTCCSSMLRLAKKNKEKPATASGNTVTGSGQPT